jgi:hypothetical protein
MQKTKIGVATGIGLAAGVVLGFSIAAGPFSRAGSGSTESDKLPRFTEEHEAAALHFVKKHLPELLPVLAELKKSSPTQYQREIREIFHDCELLAELNEEDSPRYDVELKIWVAENRAHLLVAKLSTPSEAVRKKVEEQIMDLAKDLVKWDLKILELRAEQLDMELGAIKDEINRVNENKEKTVKERYQELLAKVSRPKK